MRAHVRARWPFDANSLSLEAPAAICAQQSTTVHSCAVNHLRTTKCTDAPGIAVDEYDEQRCSFCGQAVLANAPHMWTNSTVAVDDCVAARRRRWPGSWWAHQGSNLRPLRCQRSARTN